MDERIIDCDLLVVGAGMAGLLAPAMPGVARLP